MFGRTKNAVDVTTAQRMADEDGYTIVDVRTPGERELGHPPGSIHIELETIPNNLTRLEGTKVLAFCRSGSRSHHATRFLTDQGIEALNVTGGMVAWQRASLPVRKGQ